MKFNNYTWNTGHVMRHDTDVNLHQDVIPMVRELISQGEGVVPGQGVTYVFIPGDGDPYAALTVYSMASNAAVWTTLFFLTQRQAEMATIGARALNVPRAESLPALRAPGLVTVFLPTAAIDPLPGREIEILADFAKTMFMVWALDLEEAAQKPA